MDIRSDQLTKLFWRGIDFVFPPLCAGCGRPGYRWCGDCDRNVKIICGPFCDKCGCPQSASGLCRRCASEPPAFIQLRSWSHYADPARNALIRLKYHNDISLGEIIASHMHIHLEKLKWPIDLIMPIPLGRLRQKERGYNQADLLAKPLARVAGIQYTDSALVRIRETISQVGLEQNKRRENLRGAFSASAVWLKGKTILLIDDVATTGSTLSSAADVLIKSGAKEVYAFTAARA